MEIIGVLRDCIGIAKEDPEFRSAVRGVSCSIQLDVLASSGPESISVHTGDGSSICLKADPSTWALIASPLPPVGLHAFTAAIRTGRLLVDGDPVNVAQSLHAVERLFEILRGQVVADGSEGRLSLTSLSGRYAELVLPGSEGAQVFFEQSGDRARPAMLFLHTAGADSRQYHALMTHPVLQRDWNMMAFDLPSHGRSMPGRTQAWQPYILHKWEYLQICQAFIKQCIGQPAVVVGCSMGAAMALKLAADCPEDVLGVIALEAPWRATGRRSPMLTHAQVNQAAHNPSYVRGLMSPVSPLAWRRHAAWIYSQGGFQIYDGDLAFYSDEFDAEQDLPGLNGQDKPITLLTGSYDYSASPADTQKVANLIPGARFVTMQDLGHFPMIENPQRLLDYLHPELELLKARLNKHAD